MRVLQTVRHQFRKHLQYPVRRNLLTLSGVPVIGITGTNGKTTITNLLEMVLRKAGYRTAMCCTAGVKRHGEWVTRGDQAMAAGLWLAAKGGDVDVLVAETARGGILRSGFGYKTCQIGVVTNVSDDHLGLDGVDTVDQMARVKARLVKRVSPRGLAVLNADDARVAAMAKDARCDVMFYSMQQLPANVEQGLYVDKGAIWRRRAGEDIRLMAVDDVAIARYGLLPYNVSNAMAVLGVLEGLRLLLPVTDQVAVEFLRNEGQNDKALPFRFHLYDYNGAHVLFTQSKNQAGFAADMPGIERLRTALGYEHVIGLITHAGNRLPEFHRSIAAAAANVCDCVMAVPPQDKYLRGRTHASLVKALEAGIPAAKKLTSKGMECAEIVANLQPDFPGKVLYVFLNSQLMQGAEEIMEHGRVLDYSSLMTSRQGVQDN